jgi:putative endonuclease
MLHHNYYVYITTNPGKTVLYTGVTKDIENRMNEHYEDCKNKTGSFAARYYCYNLIYYEHFENIEEAIDREKEIKGWKRVKKINLINSFNPDWRFLNDDEF